MSNSDLDELAAELADFAPPEKKGGRPASEERVIAGFEEIQRFTEKHGRAPQHGEDRDIFERLYAVRLDRLRALPDCRAMLVPLDHQGLLVSAPTLATPDEAEDNATRLADAVLRMWHTRMLRPNRLAVVDEIKNGISYYEDTFFAELPRLYAQVQDLLVSRFPDEDWQLPIFFRIGSWIGGDRDGNPFVTADILTMALKMQSMAAFNFYFAELRKLSIELPRSQLLLKVSPALADMADRSPDRNEHRADEPYRRALTGMYARLAASLRELSGTEALRHAVLTCDV